MIITPLIPFLYCFAAPNSLEAPPAPPRSPYEGPGFEFAEEMGAAMRQASSGHLLIMRDWDGRQTTERIIEHVRRAEQTATAALDMPVPEAAKKFARIAIAQLEQGVAALEAAGSRHPIEASPPLADGMLNLVKAAATAAPFPFPTGP